MKPARAAGSREPRLVAFAFRLASRAQWMQLLGSPKLPACRGAAAAALRADTWVRNLSASACMLSPRLSKIVYAGVVRVGNPSYVFYRDFKWVKDILSPGKVQIFFVKILRHFPLALSPGNSTRSTTQQLSDCRFIELLFPLASQSRLGREPYQKVYFLKKPKTKTNQTKTHHQKKHKPNNKTKQQKKRTPHRHTEQDARC